MKRRGFLKMFGAAAVSGAVPKAYADGGPIKPVPAMPAHSFPDNDVGIGPTESGGVGFYGTTPIPAPKFSRDDTMCFDNARGADQLKLVAGGLPIKLRGS